MPKAAKYESDALSALRGRGRWSEADARTALSAWAQSELSIAEFARRNSLEPQRLYAWRRQLRGDGAAGVPTFAEISWERVAGGGEEKTPAAFELVLRSGRVVRVAPTFDADALRRLLAVLGEEDVA